MRAAAPPFHFAPGWNCGKLAQLPGEGPMIISRQALLALFVVLVGAGGAAAQNTNGNSQWDSKWDVNRLLPPNVLIPPRSKLDATTLGGAASPYPNAPLESPNAASASPAPGLRLTIPSR